MENLISILIVLIIIVMVAFAYAGLHEGFYTDRNGKFITDYNDQVAAYATGNVSDRSFAHPDPKLFGPLQNGDPHALYLFRNANYKTPLTSGQLAITDMPWFIIPVTGSMYANDLLVPAALYINVVNGTYGSYGLPASFAIPDIAQFLSNAVPGFADMYAHYKDSVFVSIGLAEDGLGSPINIKSLLSS